MENVSEAAPRHTLARRHRSRPVTNAVVSAVTLCAATQAFGAPGAATCAASLGVKIPNTTITGAAYLTSPSGKYCQVNATVAPEHDVQINLPDNWKSRYLQTGGGGFDGNVPHAGTTFAAAGNDLVANGYVVTTKVRELGVGNGYNAATEEYGDLVAQGVLDPVKVTRSALVNATSIAAMLLTTETLIVEKPEDEEPAAAAGHGHGHGH